MEIKSLLGVTICAFNGCYLAFHDANGEAVGTVDLPPGIHDLSAYQPLLSVAEVRMQSCYILRSPVGRNQINTPDRLFASSAALTYTPSLAEQQEHNMRRMVKTMLREQRAEEDARAERAARSRRKNKETEDEPEILDSPDGAASGVVTEPEGSTGDDDANGGASA